jgi:hypothetical protein
LGVLTFSLHSHVEHMLAIKRVASLKMPKAFYTI